MERGLEHSVGIVQTQTVRVVEPEAPLRLKCGKDLGPIDVAYETYGQFNEQNDNAVLICHALSGNAHVAGYHSAIMSGKSSIWSLTLNNSRRLTIEVRNRTKNVVQVQGKYNRGPESRESAFVRGWAKKNGFAIREDCL